MSDVPKKKSNTGLIIAIIILAIFIIAIIGVAIYRSTVKKPQPNQKACSSDGGCTAPNICRIVDTVHNTGFCLPPCTNTAGSCPNGWSCNASGHCQAP
ncbi:MAG: hypothetical protein Solumvirus1_62 [Solumvirus sp.]|uniref:Uncharacterized protein n=1 Tax=Solumvirus sp. TaxID=2487773 RepID=A0A3G5AG84_9VIRU|nr:MAG: hypothetical protein Solumvirus1_62 [Solumvirus sp.]